jgi:tetratricopeptide (TPR) repeat protein
MSKRTLLQRILLATTCIGVALALSFWWSGRAEKRLQKHLETAPLTELQELARKRDWDTNLFYWLGVRQEQAGRVAEAVESLKRAVSLAPKSARSQTALRRVLESDRQARLRQASLPELMQVAAKKRDDPIVWYWLGAKLTEMGKQEKSVQALSRSVALNPRSAPSRAALGLVLARLNRASEAEAQLKEGIALNPKLQFAHFALGNLYGKYNRWEQAAVELKTACDLSPDDHEANYLLAVCYGNLFQEDRKMDILERLTQRYPDNLRDLKSLGYVYVFYGKFAQAEALYRHILTLEPNDQETRYLLGRSLAEQAVTPQAFAVAEKELKDVAARVPDNPGVHLALGILFFRRNEPARAVQELERAIALHIPEHKTWLYLGQSYMRVGRTADAQRALATFQRTANTKRLVSQLENRLLNTPADGEARLRLVRVYMDDKDYQRARNHLRLLLTQDKGNAQALKLARECDARIKAAPPSTDASQSVMPPGGM